MGNWDVRITPSRGSASMQIRHYSCNAFLAALDRYFPAPISKYLQAVADPTSRRVGGTAEPQTLQGFSCLCSQPPLKLQTTRHQTSPVANHWRFKSLKNLRSVRFQSKRGVPKFEDVEALHVCDSLAHCPGARVAYRVLPVFVSPARHT